MFTSVYIFAVIALFFYIVIPIVGAFFVRNQWRLFRKRVTDYSLFQELNFNAFSNNNKNIGNMKISGTIEAILGENKIWVKSKDISCVVELKDSFIYVLSGEYLHALIERKRWSQLSYFTHGSKIFVAGNAYIDGAEIVFREDPATPLLIITYDGNDYSLIRRALWTGRHKNEYWNPTTKISLSLGLAILGVMLTQVLNTHNPSLINSLILVISFSPALPLLPPGVLLFFNYRKYWKKARYCRARRDMDEFEKRDGKEKWKKRAFWATALSMSFFSIAVIINFFIGLYALRSIL